MADMQTALRGRLTATAAGSRVYFRYAPQGAAKPFIVLSTISDPRPEHLKGYQTRSDTRVQVDCFAETYEAGRSLAEAVVAAVATPGTYGGIRFGRVKAEGPQDLGEDTAAGFVHRMQLDLNIEHRPA